MTHSRRNFLRTAAVLATSTAMPLPLRSIAAPRSSKLRLSFRPYDLLLRHTFTLSGSSRTMTPVVLTQIEYDGLTGYGEASLPPYLGETQASVADFLGKVDLSGFSSPFELEDILHYVDHLADHNTAAKASVDIALHDLVGKILGQPWHRIWGFNPDKTPPTSFTIGMDTPEVVRQKTLEAAPLYKILKVKLGRDNDRELIQTIRSVTDKPLAVDANQGWKDKHEALDLIHWLSTQGVVLVEQPLSKHRLDDAAWLNERSPLPVFADEAFQRLTDYSRIRGAYAGVNIKLMKCTGMREASKIITLAKADNLRIMIGCMTETSCAISAAAQLSPVADFADLDGNLLITNDPFRTPSLSGGRLLPPQAPGIGLLPLSF
jgi:L-alanine-DL-glutamate epimerase-like enolase superfamily enzyme